MKKIIFTASVAILGLLAHAQTKVTLPSFTKIVVPANFEVKLQQSEKNEVSYQNADSKNTNISALEKGASVSNNTLNFDLAPFGSNLPVEVIIYVTNLEEIKLESNATMKMGGDSAIKSKSLKISADGATKMDLFVDVEKLEAKINGASKLSIDGKVTEGNLEATGASKIDAMGTAFENAVAEASGASKILVTVKNNLKAEATGFSKIEYTGNPKNVEKQVSGGSKVEQVNDDGEDGKVEISIGAKKGKKGKHKKHSTEMETAFGGIELGVGSFVTPDFNTTLAASNKNLETNIGSSWRFALNFGDWDLPIVKGRLALTTGLGLSFDHYGFKNKDSMISDNNQQLTFITPAATLSTNRLYQFNFTLPLLVKYNSSYNKHDKRFYTAFGVMIKYAAVNHVKTVYSKNSVDYETVASGDYFVNRLAADATVRIGYGAVSVFANYGLVPLFDTNKVLDTRTAQAGLALNF
jgi:hypothetical protein